MTYFENVSIHNFADGKALSMWIRLLPALQKMCQNNGFHWLLFSSIRTGSQKTRQWKPFFSHILCSADVIRLLESENNVAVNWFTNNEMIVSPDKFEAINLDKKENWCN